MITRRNWLLRCSIFINIAVLLYICSHVMIGTSNLTIVPNYILQEDYSAAAAAAVSNNAAAAKLQSQTIYMTSQQNQNTDGQNPSSDKDIQQQQQQQLVVDESIISGRDLLLKKSQPLDQTNKNPVDNENIDDTRYIVSPTDLSLMIEQQQQELQEQQKQIKQNQNKINNEINYQDVNYLNNSINENVVGGVVNDGGTGASLTVVTTTDDLETRLKSLIECHNKDYKPETLQRGDFWVLKNYVRASHGELRCFETITYTTHADYTFLDNLIPLLERWNAPISIALHAPGTDFMPTIKAIKYLRDCRPESDLVRKFTTFHIYFSSKHIPKFVPKFWNVLEVPINCSQSAPYDHVSAAQLYKTQKKLLYPVNVGRNIARDASMTHFILASDIELYPNPGLVNRFLEMIARNDPPLQHKNPKVFPLSIFEVDSTSQVPKDKTELQELLRNGKAIPFHKRVCSSCHGVPKSKEWMSANETDELGIFHVGKRIGYFVHWEPIYIGTNADPHYDERLSWEGKSDKMTQGYALCVLDYEFQILDNAFLVHKPGIKILKKDPKRAMLAAKTNQLIKKIIYPELQVMYGSRKGCAV